MLLILLLFLVGCLSSNKKIVALYPSKTHKCNQTIRVSGKLHISVESLENLKSINIPILDEHNYLAVHKALKWLREPNKLLKEYLEICWIEMGGTIHSVEQIIPDQLKNSEHKSIHIILNTCYLDKITNKYQAIATLMLEDKIKLFKQNADKPDTALVNLANTIFEYLRSVNYI